jgi:hypothetical protein
MALSIIVGVLADETHERQLDQQVRELRCHAWTTTGTLLG